MTGAKSSRLPKGGGIWCGTTERPVAGFGGGGGRWSAERPAYREMMVEGGVRTSTGSRRRSASLEDISFDE